MKIFIGPMEIAGIATGICEGFRKLDLRAEAVFRYAHSFCYSNERNDDWMLQKWIHLSDLNQAASGSFSISKIIRAISVRLWSILILVRCLCRYDAFIFMFGHTITNSKIELRLMKALRKRIIFLYLGSDARPPFCCGAFFPQGCPIDLSKAKTITEKSRQRIQWQEKYADVCINSPATGHFHVKPFINWFAIGLPKRIEVCPTEEIRRQPQRKTRILHCPSESSIKGSQTISSVIDKLIRKGHYIEFVKIEGVPNSVVLKELKRCDFVIDQLYSDTPMASFATEAAHLGKPAVIGGYFSVDMHKYIKKENIPPSLFVHPDDIEQAIEKLIVDVEYRLKLGRQAQMFVRTQWAPEAVAKRLLQLIEGNIPDEWWFDPQTIRYVHGGGVPAAQVRRIVHGLIDHFGIASLQMADKPDLEKAFLEFALLDADDDRC